MLWISGAEVLRMETVQKSSESLSKGSGAAVGAGAVILPQMFQHPPAQASQVLVVCPKCRFRNPQTSKFCGSCGTTLQAAQTQNGISCPKCETANATGAKFCLNCGNPLQTSVKCLKCNSKIQAGTKFCPNCGS
jgi:NADH pyrophosphatase NudC (nudix superfamily)